MSMSKRPVPKLVRKEPKGKITTYPKYFIEELFVLGKQNGHDTPKLVREAVEKIILDHAEELKRPAS